MSELNLEHLIGGFATNTLTEVEHQTLFKAAMVNQRLFDLLADEQALKELLDDPAVRRRLLQQLKQPQGQTPPSWFERTLGWMTRLETLAVAGSLAVLALATFFGLRLYEESQRLLQEEQSKPALSEVLKEATVRAKLGAKPSAPAPPPPADDEVAEPRNETSAARREPAKTSERQAPGRLTSKPVAGRAAPSSGAAPASTPAEDSARTQSLPLQDAGPSAPPHIDQGKRLGELSSAPTPMPPVVLPRVPEHLRKGKTVEKAITVPKPDVPPAADAPIIPPSTEGSNGPTIRESSPPTAAPALRAEEPTAPEARPTAPGPPEPSRPEPFIDNLRVPAVGNARALFFASAETASETAGTNPVTEPSREAQPGEQERRRLLGALSAPPREETPGGDIGSREQAPIDAPPPAAAPLGVRFHRRHLPLQGSEPQPFQDTFVIPHMRIEVNQPGYLYVITEGAGGTWTVLTPAGTIAEEGMRRAAMAKRGTPYQVMLVGDTSGGASRPTYLVFSRAPEPALDRALALATGLEQPASASLELDALLTSWIRTFAPQTLRTEQASEAIDGGRPRSVTYVADGSRPPKASLLYRLPTGP